MLLDSAPALAILNFAVATMPIEFLDFTVWIDSEGQELQEYEIQVEDENTVSCYIASEVGKVGQCSNQRHTTTRAEHH